MKNHVPVILDSTIYHMVMGKEVQQEQVTRNSKMKELFNSITKWQENYSIPISVKECVEVSREEKVDGKA